MNLPFNLKAKPLNKYLEGGVIRFNMVDGHLYFTIRHIIKGSNSKLIVAEVRSKEQLDKLLSIKSLHEIPTIEAIN